MGLSCWPAKGPRRSGSSQKARRNLPLEFCFRGYSQIRRRISPLGLISAEKIEIALDGGACAHDDFERLKAGVTDLQTSAILAILNQRVVQLQFSLCCQYIIRTSANKVKFPY